MAPLGYEIDASFYSLIHQLSRSQQVEQMVERRGERRTEFVSTQRIALPSGPGVPHESKFFDVQCRDLTRKGFSFFSPSPPSFQTLVVALGIPPEVIYLAAQVTHCSQVLVDSAGRHGENGRTAMVLVGCQFVRRINP